MIDISALQSRFPNYRIISQPAPGCTCKDGVRTKNGNQFPCLCVCIGAPQEGEQEYRNILRHEIAESAKAALEDLESARGSKND